MFPDLVRRGFLLPTRLKNSYEGAGTGGRASGWKAGNGGPVGLTTGSLATLRNRSRKGVRDDPYAFSERNSPVLTNPFISQRLTRFLKLPKRPLPTTFLPQKADFQSDRIIPLSFQRLSRVTYLYRRNLQPIRRTNYLPTEAI